jgi:probable phosphomutase (TIGR03848 family)
MGENNMTLIILVRHGENDYVKKGRLAGRLPQVHLNEKGRAQAKETAEALCRMFEKAPLKAIYSSPLERTMETAEPISQAFNLPIIPREGLIETDCGEWQGKSVKQLSRLKIWKTVQSSPSLFRFPGGETFAETQHRISQELRELSVLHEAKDAIVCVSHSDPIKLAVAYFLGLPLDLFQRIAISPTSITALQVSESGSHLLTLNYNTSFIIPQP